MVEQAFKMTLSNERTIEKVIQDENVHPKSEEVRSRIFTTGASGYPGCAHIEADENGKKDFSQIIEMTKTLKAP